MRRWFWTLVGLYAGPLIISLSMGWTVMAVVLMGIAAALGAAVAVMFLFALIALENG